MRKFSYFLFSGNNLILCNDYVNHDRLIVDNLKDNITEEDKSRLYSLNLDFNTIEEKLLGILYFGSIKIRNNAIEKDDYYKKL